MRFFHRRHPAPASLLAVLALIAAFGATARPAHASDPAEEMPRGCALTLLPELIRQAEMQRQAQAAAGTPVAGRVQAVERSGRTYLTPHFAIQYTLAPSVHRVRIDAGTPADVALKSTVDSLLAALAALGTYRRDSTLHARLDSLGAAHPLYILKVGEYFERAWNYYDSLGMKMPAYTSTSQVYDRPSQGRYVVDVADANIAGGFSGPYYGVSYPPSQGGRILFENDFLYNVTYNGITDQVSGIPVRALWPGNTIYRDYSQADWEKGVKVTASHEFYHSVQYAYDSTLNNIHAWYELSATGMEERLAPEVNDYFQYVRFNIPKSHSVSLLTAGTTENYGNAVFFIFMTKALGAGFDKAIWQALGATDNLPLSLVQGVGSQARWDSLYSAYAGAMVLSGSAAAAASPLAFSPDMPSWSRPRFDTVPASGLVQFDQPALTFRLIRPPQSDTGLVTLVGHSEIRLVDSSASGYQTTPLSQSVLRLTRPGAGTVTTLAAANTSITQTRQVVLSKGLTETYAVRNPVSRTQSPLVFLAPTGGLTDSLKIVAESGRRVATLAADTSGLFWTWNLKDPQNRTVPSGLYFFRTTGGNTSASIKNLVVLP